MDRTPIDDTVGDEPEQTETTMEQLLSDQANLVDKLGSKQVTRVRVVQVLEDKVLVDIGEKHEGIVPRSEFTEDNLPQPEGRIPVVLEKKARGEEPAVLSFKKARAQLGWDALKTAKEASQRVKGRVLAWIKGGYRVDVEGVEAFMPISQSELRTPPRHRLPVGSKVKCYVLEMQDDRRQAVVSRRKVLEEDEGKRRDETLGKLQPGQIVRGWISHVTDAGVFVNLGGVEGLVQLADIDWKEPEKAKTAYQRGQRISAKVLRVEEGKVHLGLKQLKANPADGLKRKFPPKTQVKATIVKVLPEGAQVSIGSVPGWVALEEFAHDSNEKAIPPKEGEVVKAIVLGIRFSQFDVNLSIKRFEDIEDRKRIQKYMRKAPPLTLGQLLTGGQQEEE